MPRIYTLRSFLTFGGILIVCGCIASTRIKGTETSRCMSAVNILPYNLGISPGGNWEQAQTGFQLSGNLAQYEARGILLTCTVGDLPSVQLAFAWTRAEHVPLLFGQVNLFMEFDVCFFRARNSFEVRSNALP